MIYYFIIGVKKSSIHKLLTCIILIVRKDDLLSLLNYIIYCFLFLNVFSNVILANKSYPSQSHSKAFIINNVMLQTILPSDQYLIMGI